MSSIILTNVEAMRDALTLVMSPDQIESWLNEPNEAFGGKRPIDLTDLEPFWEMMHRLESGMPG